MEKLTIKELAPYLPYGLQIFGQNFEYKDSVWEMVSADSFSGIPINAVDGIELKPILRPLSDLTKEIEVNGERFNVVYRLHVWQEQLLHIAKRNSMEPYELPFNVVQFLIECHFDVFGLIEKGLAIDINQKP